MIYRHAIATLLLAVLVFGFPAAGMTTDTDSAVLRSTYLESIHEDCRVFLENMELFIRRDYPKFWDQMAAGSPIPAEDVEKYVSEQKNFEKLLDALFREFFSFRTESAAMSPESGTASRIQNIETEIYQMLAYAYIKTCDFSMGRALLQKANLAQKDVTLPIMDIEGNVSPFHLTKALVQLEEMMNTNLSILEIRLRYFSPSDIQHVDAYLVIDDFNTENPFNQVFLHYFQGMFPSLSRQGKSRIHFNEIIHYFDRLRYNNLLDNKTGETDNGSEIRYAFPVLKGRYEVQSNDPAIAVESLDPQIIIERLCDFKGFERTDFRILKGAEIKQLKQKTIIDKGLSMEATTEKSITQASTLTLMEGFERIRPGQRLRYGFYRLFENDNYLGAIELIPCFKGNECRQKTSSQAITPVKIFNHELVFFQDILDLIERNQMTYGKTVPQTSAATEVETPARTKKTTNRLPPDEIHIGRGCGGN